MKKIFKNRLFIFILGIVISGSIATYAAIKIQANEIGYKDGTVEDALDNLYSNPAAKKFCKFVESDYGTPNNPLSIGSKYECQLGENDKDGNNLIYRNFYILAVDGDRVDLIMDRNITKGTMTWTNAMKYFSNNNEGIAYKSKWTNILAVDLPKAQDIVNAIGYNEWKVAEYSDISTEQWFYFETRTKTLGSTTNYEWLWDYLQGCSSYNCQNDPGSEWAYTYATRDNNRYGNSMRAWTIFGYGGYIASGYPITDNSFGLRPVITILKSNLYEEE